MIWLPVMTRNFLQLLGFYIKQFMSLVVLYSEALVTLCYWFT
jgi:hypothetical protein